MLSALAAAFISPIVSMGSAFAVWHLTGMRDRRKGMEGDEKTWRAARLAAEQALRDELRQETSERLQWQLKNESDLAQIANILDESTEAHKLLAGIAATTRHLEGQVPRLDQDIRQLHERLNTMTNHIMQLHAKP